MKTKVELLCRCFENRKRFLKMISILHDEARYVEPTFADALLEVMKLEWSIDTHEVFGLEISLSEWLEQIIEQRFWEVEEHCEQKNEELYNQFISELNKIRNQIPNETLSTLEDLFVQNYNIARIAFRSGVNVGRVVEQTYNRLVTI
ncbi:hypothetical protein [Paenibacillus apiarius]|uniref:hypothetical protein n=1 Tax=Paenibacillus apiarius TaxID=46240 RepID=UPI003B3A081F